MADHKALARKFNDDVMSGGNLDLLDELIADDFVEHQEFPGLPPGRDGLRAFVQMFRSAFPDLKVETLAVVEEGDEIWVHSRMTGTHRGEFAGVAPTGKPVSVEMIDRVRLRGDQAVEHWGVSDDLGMMTQLGVVPEMG